CSEKARAPAGGLGPRTIGKAGAGGMPRTAQFMPGGYRRGFGQRWHAWRETFSGIVRRISEGVGATLVLASFLLLLALLTYSPRDASLNTAVAAAPRNYLGNYGALVADL